MDSKFAHLLQPIRDLAGNWDVNVAEELEEYLEELENIHFDLEEDASPSLNFAEAALVIQGSTSVYSKKVEYLHSLVYAALEAIAEKRAQKVSREDDDGNDASDVDTEEQFLTLDDIAEGGGDIDMQEECTRGTPAAIRAPTSLLILGQCKGPMSLSRAQTYTDASGAVLIDPADSMGSCETQVRVTNPQNEAAPTVPEMAEESAVDGPSFEPMDSTPVPDFNGGAYDGEDWEDGHDAASMTSEASEEQDPYQPLEWDQPGNLPRQPFKYKKPSKRHKPKKDQSLKYGSFVSVPAVGQLALQEFRGYLELCKDSSTRLKENDAADSQEQMLEEGDSGDDGDAGCGDYSDDEMGEPNGGDMDSFSPLAYGSIAFENPSQEAFQGTQGLTQEPMPGWREADVKVEDELLEKRVAEWQQKIQPLLDEQAPSFDIGMYGQQILGVMASEVQAEEWSSFGVVACNQKQFEVTRLFASMLQLVNAGSLRMLKT